MDNRLDSVTLISEIKLNDRKKISLSGLKKLVSFDPEEFVMDTNLGPLVLKGNNLEIVKLDIIDGNLQIKGKINSLIYLDGKDSKKDNGLLAKLFKWVLNYNWYALLFLLFMEYLYIGYILLIENLFWKVIMVGRLLFIFY